MNFPFTKYSIFYYVFSGVLILATIVSLFIFGLKFGIEFTGGSLMEIEFSSEGVRLPDGQEGPASVGQRPSNEAIRSALAGFDLGEVAVRPIGEKSAVLQFKGVDEEVHQQILAELNNLFPVVEKSFQYIGPSVGRELRNKTQIAIVLALLAITVYIAFAFRKVSRPVASWKYGITSLIALFHDILIPIGVFSVLGHLYNVEITIPIIAALLTVLGFSVHDTIVIFDRIRENVLRRGMSDFEGTVNLSLNQTLGRSVNTTLSTLFVLFAIYFFGGETLRYFALALIIGITFGAYSSIFIASPLLVAWYKTSSKKQ